MAEIQGSIVKPSKRNPTSMQRTIEAIAAWRLNLIFALRMSVESESACNKELRR